LVLSRARALADLGTELGNIITTNFLISPEHVFIDYIFRPIAGRYPVQPCPAGISVIRPIA
jgi:hypothetical protein